MKDVIDRALDRDELSHIVAEEPELRVTP
jgi:hypothetical protein